MKGRVFGPKPLWLAVSAGVRLQTRTTRMYYERRLELLNAVVLRGPGNPVGVHTPYVSGGLADAALAVLARSRSLPVDHAGVPMSTAPAEGRWLCGSRLDAPGGRGAARLIRGDP
jgi:hypothetical protein